MPYFTTPDGLTMRELKHVYALYQLDKYNNNKSKASERLGISRSTLREILGNPEFKTDECSMCSEITRVVNHHIVPKKQGGSDDPENLALLCHRCHNRLHNKFLSPVIDKLK